VAETSDEKEPLNARSGEAGADGARDGHSGGSHPTADGREDSASADAAPNGPSTDATSSHASDDGSSAGDADDDGDSEDSEDAADTDGGTDGEAAADTTDATDTATRTDALDEADEAANEAAADEAGEEPADREDREAEDEEPQPGDREAHLDEREREARRRASQIDTAPLDPVTGETVAPEPDDEPAPETPAARELHSGHKLAGRYRLEECVTRLDGFSSWRAVDEKLRRAVGVHVLPAGHRRARPVLSAARSAALLGDPRFVQVLDAVEDGDLVYVVHEWLPDAVPLSELLAGGCLEPYEAYQLVSQLAQALTAAHREGLAHLRLTPAAVLRTGTGQYRVRGLAVNAALRGLTSDAPQRADTEAIGALLYAALTQRWPYEEDAYGLTGVGTLAKGTLLAPDQVRAGVHRGLSQLAMRALVNDGATAASEEQPCATPEELVKAIAAMPRIRPPESTRTPAPYQHTTYQKGAYGPGRPNGPVPAAAGAGASAGPPGEAPAPPALPGRTGKVLKWGVSALLIVALGLGSWQLAGTLLKENNDHGGSAGEAHAQDHSAGSGKPVRIHRVTDFDPPPGNGSENPQTVDHVRDGDPSTYWSTIRYDNHPDFGHLKPGAGLILDLGKPQSVSKVKVDFKGATSAELRAAPRNTAQQPTSLSGFSKLGQTTGEHVTLKPKKPVTSQYVLVWLTKLPSTEDGNYRGRITEIHVQS